MSIRRALLSVSDKTGIVELARALRQHGVELLSTGGTFKLLQTQGVEAREVASYTGFPEIMDGRVKTLHPRIHAGLLGRRGTDEAVMRDHGIDPIDLLVVNLYPFAATIAKPGCTYDDAVENIDIGGPAMLRAAAKNHADVTVLIDPADYAGVLAELASTGGSTLATRKRLAAKCYAHTAAYDTLVSAYLQRQLDPQLDGAAGQFPSLLELRYRKVLDLRYGENPHQHGAFYQQLQPQGGSVGSAQVLQGKELSYNNIADADAAIECVRQFSEPACVIVKHANPCGVAVAGNIFDAYDRAHRTDPTSAYGGIIAFNRELDLATAQEIMKRQFAEVLAATAVPAATLAALAGKANLRVLATGALQPIVEGPEVKSVTGGLLVQDRDNGRVEAADLRVVSRRKPTPAELADLLFCWRVAKFVKSNAIVFARDGRTIGVGAGQMSRVYSSRIAAIKAEDEKLEVRGAVMASDAFFPFRDGIDIAASYGITAVIHPGGSKRDDEVIAAADEHGMAMVYTGMRHFRH